MFFGLEPTASILILVIVIGLIGGILSAVHDKTKAEPRRIMMRVNFSPLETTVLHQLAEKQDLTPEQTLRQALRYYQQIEVKAEQGLRLAFVDAAGAVVREPVGGCMGDD